MIRLVQRTCRKKGKKKKTGQSEKRWDCLKPSAWEYPNGLGSVSKPQERILDKGAKEEGENRVRNEG